MSSVGFTPSTEKELEQLREAWKTLIDLQKNLVNAETCLKNIDLTVTAHHLKVAPWNLERAKQAIKIVGQGKSRKES